MRESRPPAADHPGPSAATEKPHEPRAMIRIGIRELARNLSAVVAGVIESGCPAVVTKHGAPVAMVVPVRPGAADDDDLSLQRAIDRLGTMVHGDPQSGSAPSGSFADQLAKLAEALEGVEPHLRHVSETHR